MPWIRAICVAHPRAEPGEQLGLALEQALFGAQDLRFVLLELRRDVALGAGQRLAPLVVGGNPGPVRVGHLEEIPEDLVVADLERGDAGAFALPLLQRGEVLLPAVAEHTQLVELGVEAGSDDVTVGERNRWPFRERRGKRRREVGEGIELRAERVVRSAPSSARCSGSSPSSAAATAGSRRNESRSAPRSRGVARPAAARPARRSRSRTPSSAERAPSRARAFRSAASTASSRVLIAVGSRSGESTQRRSSRAPIGVTVRSMASSRVTPLAPLRSGSTSSRLRRVISSTHMNRSARRTTGRCRWGMPPGWRSVRYRSRAPAAPTAGHIGALDAQAVERGEPEAARDLVAGELRIELPPLPRCPERFGWGRESGCFG